MRVGLCPQVRRRTPAVDTRVSHIGWPATVSERKWSRRMRLLYVATSRARDLLILSASVLRQNSIGFGHPRNPGDRIDLSARTLCGLAWPVVFPTIAKGNLATRAGENALLRWQIHDDTRLLEPGSRAGLPPPPRAFARVAASRREWSRARRPFRRRDAHSTNQFRAECLGRASHRLSWTYPHSPPLTGQPKLR